MIHEKTTTNFNPPPKICILKSYYCKSCNNYAQNKIQLYSFTDIRSPKSLNSMIFELLITLPKLSLFRRLKFILTSINHLQYTETKNRLII